MQTDLFEERRRAVSFSLLLDGSGSMGLVGKMKAARAAVRALVAQKLPGDDFALYVFSSGEVREIVPFTADTAKLIAAVDAVTPHGRTAFYDALARMPDRTLLGRNGSRAIVLLTDGIDNASELSRDDLAALLEGVDVPVYPIGLRSPARRSCRRRTPAAMQNSKSRTSRASPGVSSRSPTRRTSSRPRSRASRRTFARSTCWASRPRAPARCATAGSRSDFQAPHDPSA